MFDGLFPATLFRFLRRSRYSIPGALDMLTSTLTWRLRTDLDSLSLSSLHPLYCSPVGKPPLFWCNTNCYDRYGRPIGVINLQSLERVVHDDGQSGLEECREYIVACMETLRRYLDLQYGKSMMNGPQPIDIEGIKEQCFDEHSKFTKPKKPLQMVIVFSLASSGMANLELELLPFLLDLLKNHFPGMVGAAYVLHFGWVHSGMWALAKRILPEQALARIFFPTGKDLYEHFPLEHLPIPLGGEMEIEMNENTNDVMRKFAQPRWNRYRGTTDQDSEEASALHNVSSAPPSPRLSGASTPVETRPSMRTPRLLSRTGSFDSLVDDFYSVENSPRASKSVTPRVSRPSTPHIDLAGFTMSRQGPEGLRSRGNSAASSHIPLRLTPSAASKLQYLQSIRGGTRSRTNSEVQDGSLPEIGSEMVSLQSGVDLSPSTSRPPSPVLSRRRAPSNLRPRTSQFDPGNSGHIRRIGSLRDFRLMQDDYARGSGVVGEVSGSESSSEYQGSEGESDTSGKAGEISGTSKMDPSTPVQSESSRPNIFARIRRSYSRHHPSVEDQESVQEKGRTSDVNDSDDGDLTILAPEPIPGPDSPHLQVPHIDEPPLSETSHLFSRRTRQYQGLPGHVSPYNASNPFYGYPAYPETNNMQFVPPSNDPRRRYQFRKRKRDLLRTLMYLFVLRLLAMHRRVRSALLATYRGIIRAVSVGGIAAVELPSTDNNEAILSQQRYERLKSAGARFSSEDEGRRAQSFPAHSRRNSSYRQQGPIPQQPQPLVVLGMKKRYLILSVIVFYLLLRRYEWRRRT